MAEAAISSCFYMTGSASLPQNSPINTLREVFKLCMATYLSTHILSPPYRALGYGLSCQAKFHPKQFLNTHPINPPKSELVMEILTET